MIFLSLVEKIFWVAQNFVYNPLPMFLRAFCNQVCALAPVLCEKSAFFHVFSTKSAKFGHFEAKHLHERERSWC